MERSKATLRGSFAEATPRWSATVKAAVMKQPGVLELQQFPLPDPEPGAVVLKMSMSGICGTDKHTFRGETLQYAETPHERRIDYPLICGHENVGQVAATGGEVLDSGGRALAEGDRVVPAANVSCALAHGGLTPARPR